MGALSASRPWLRLRPLNCRRSCIEVGTTRTLDDWTPACPQHWVLCQSPLCQIIRWRENEVSYLYHRPLYVPQVDRGRASWKEASERPLHVLRCQVSKILVIFVDPIISFVNRERPVRNESYSVQLQFGVKYVWSITVLKQDFVLS